MRAPWLGAGNVVSQYAEWHSCVNNGRSTSVCHHVYLHIYDFSMDARLEQKTKKKSAWNSANLERILLKWYDVRMEMKLWIVQGVSSGTRFSREADHHSKTTRGKVELPRAQQLKMWKQFGSDWMRIVGEPLRTLLQSLVPYRTVQTVLTCYFNMHRVAEKFVPRLLTPEQRAPCCNLSRASSACPGWPIVNVEGQHWGRVGSTGMIASLNKSSQWKSQGSPRPKTARQSSSATKSMLNVFEGLCTMHLPLKARPLPPCSTAMFFAVWRRTFGENDLNRGARAIGFSMIMQLATEVS